MLRSSKALSHTASSVSLRARSSQHRGVRSSLGEVGRSLFPVCPLQEHPPAVLAENVQARQALAHRAEPAGHTGRTPPTLLRSSLAWNVRDRCSWTRDTLLDQAGSSSCRTSRLMLQQSPGVSLQASVRFAMQLCFVYSSWKTSLHPQRFHYKSSVKP